MADGPTTQPSPGMLQRILIGITAALERMLQNIVTALVQIWANKGRALLTTLGIIIAVTSIISVVSFVEGFGNYMTNMLRGIGTQYMVVYPARIRGENRRGIGRVTMDVHDIRAVIAECPNVRRISPFVYAEQSDIEFGDEMTEDIPVRGVSEHYQTIRNFRADAGRFFGPVDIDGAKQVVVLGRSLLELLRTDESIIGQYVRIDALRFQVVGLLESKGSFGNEDQDKTVMIPYTTAFKLYPQLSTSVRFLAESTSEEDIPLAEEQMTRVLRQQHGLQPHQPNDFGIFRQDQVLTEFESIKRYASGALAGIVSISLLVGGIGIMNVMLVAVSERTREIGLRKSIGGRRRDIMLQFLTEAVVLCTFGGCIGVLLGYGITHIAGMHPLLSDLEMGVPVWAVALALGFSAATGIVFGIFPAAKAAIMHPIDALRHE